MRMTKKNILGQLWAVATADVASVVSLQDGAMVLADTKDWPEDVRLAVAGMEKTGGNIKIKFYDKLKALELLGKHLGLFEKAAETDDKAESLLEQLLETIANGEWRMENGE